MNTPFAKSLNLRLPIIAAPMFLVSYLPLIEAAIEAGIMGCFPSLNFRDDGELENVLQTLNAKLDSRKGQNGNYGVNLIVQRANPFYAKHLKICVDNKIPVYITSLGNPKETIEAAHSYGAKVFCDVTNVEHAAKCFENNCDGFIAVSQGAGGHAGPFPLMLLTESLKKNFPDKPVLAAGGIASGNAIAGILAAGADCAYIGTRFIATTEAKVSDEYKNAVVDAHMQDIVMTSRISGTPCTIINTPFAQKIGTKQNWFERWMSNNPRTKKYFKMLIQRRGFNWLEDAVKPGNYNNLWCAGQSVEMIDEIKSLKEVVNELERELNDAVKAFQQKTN